MAALVEETENLTISGSPDKQVDTRFYSKLAIDQQRELFLWKYPDIKREAVLTSEAGFIKHNLTKSGQLDEHEAAMYLEDMGVAKTGSEIRQMFVNMDKDGNHLISFVEWCCAYYEKDYDEFNNFSDESARIAALEAAAKAGEEAKAAEEQLQALQEAREFEAAKRAKEIEEESKLSGVAGMRAFFFRKVEAVQDTTKTNQQQISEEYTKRKAIREAKAKAIQAEADANKQVSVEEVAEQAYKSARRQSMVRHQSEKEIAEMEKMQRQARKEAMNAKWGSPPAK